MDAYTVQEADRHKITTLRIHRDQDFARAKEPKLGFRSVSDFIPVIPLSSLNILYMLWDIYCPAGRFEDA
jgi:hypothetical protein